MPEARKTKRARIGAKLVMSRSKRWNRNQEELAMRHGDGDGNGNGDNIGQ